MTARVQCPSCRIRHAVPPPTWNADYNAITVDESVIRVLMKAASLFDREADEPHTAREFVEWLTPDLRGGPKTLPDYSGILRNGMSPSAADPLPMVPAKLRRMVS